MKNGPGNEATAIASGRHTIEHGDPRRRAAAVEYLDNLLKGAVRKRVLPILDDIGRAREHDELNGGFKSVGESLEALVTKLGLKKYGESGDEFDPNVHEALTMVPSADVTVPTVIEVFQPGYLIGERVLRPARVVVAGPGEENVETPGEAVAGAEAAEPPPGEPGEPAPGPEADGEQQK